MNIKQIEQETGLSRANIRYYETEGLLAPARAENGYRDYSTQDVLTLSRIKLLRRLDIPVEKIRQLQTGQERLDAVIDQRLSQIESQHAALAQAQEILSAMRTDGAAYETLDADKYLTRFDRPLPMHNSTEQPKPSPVPTQDVERIVPYPWRRFFARGLDLSLCELLFTAFLYLVLRLHPLTGQTATFLPLIFGVFLMFVLEPVLIHFFGTTPGKWLFGIHIEAEEGGKLTYAQARARTGGAIVFGEGLCIPLWSLWRNWKSYRACVDGEPLSWEDESRMVLRDRATWRAVAYVAAVVLLALAETALTLYAQLPLHRGPLTQAQFAENFNDLAAYQGYLTDKRLDADLNWMDVSDSYVIYAFGDPMLPAFTTTSQDGQLTSVQMTIAYDGATYSVGGFDTAARLSYLSFVGAQPQWNRFDFFNGPNSRAFKQTPGHYTFTQNGVLVEYDLAYDGYIEGFAQEGFFWPEEGATPHFECVLTMTVQ